MVNVFFYSFYGIIKSIPAFETHLIYSESADPVISRPYDPINGRIGLSKPLLISPHFFYVYFKLYLFLFKQLLFFSDKKFYVCVYRFEQNQIYWQYFFGIK